MRKTQLKGIAALAVAAFIWGSTFVAQSIGMENLGPFSYNGIRTLMGAAVLLPFVLLRAFKRKKQRTPAEEAAHKRELRALLGAGTALGIALCVAANLQQAAFAYTSSAKIAFITALYMLFVPLFGLVFGKKPALLTWAGVLAGIAGLYLLSFPGDTPESMNRGDLLSLACAVGFAVQILLAERYAGRHDPIQLSFIQFIVSGALSCIMMLLFETPSVHSVRAAIWPLLYAGVLSSGVAYTLQLVGQRHTEATLASLIMCTESIFGLVSAAIVLHEIPTGRELLGCALMFAAIITVQFTERKKAAKTQ